MGGFGSGRIAAFGRATVGSVVSLDVNRMHRAGCLRAGWSGGWQWRRADDAADRLGLSVEQDRVVLRYRVSVAGGPWHDVSEAVAIERVACGFGGSRTYMRCPGAGCDRRIVKLYLHGR